jgi:ribosomal-protein-alanine N-acetyltransferase
MGIMTEALLAVMDFLFSEVGMHRIAAFHDEQNDASGRVMQKAGMVYEGKLREDRMRKDGTYSDMCIYGILDREWKDRSQRE